MQVGSNQFGGSSAIPQYINQYSKAINKSLERLASGLRVQHPSESSTEFFKAQSLDRRVSENSILQRNLDTHLSRVRSVDGYLDTVGTMLDDMAVLAKEASNETDTDLRTNMGQEFDAKYEALQTFINSARYEGEAILTGTYDTSAGGSSLSAQIDEDMSDTYSYEILDTSIDSATGLNLSAYSDATTDFADASGQANALSFYEALTEGDSGLSRLTRNANRIGTHDHILSGAQNSLATKNSNYEAASSALVGVDDAAESTRLSSLQIRQQAAASFLVQNNLVKGNVIGTLSSFSAGSM